MSRKYNFKCRKIIYQDSDSKFFEKEFDFELDKPSDVNFLYLMSRIFNEYNEVTITINDEGEVENEKENE